MRLAAKTIQPATLADLERIPPTWRGEIIDGTLYAFPRPRAPHARVEGRVYGDLDGPFDRGRDGPGGWWILPEPGIELPRAPEFSPDVAGWRKERLPRLPKASAITVVPDWICEVLSRRTRSYDNIVKRRFYAEIGVGYLWYVDPLARTVMVSQLVEGRWVELGYHGEDEKVRLAPFEAVEIDLSAWWEGFEEDQDEEEESGP
ncbi:Uma2 family endonuclease [Polyangium aurulentum]|uniref:Uma2 family endonuclease n=1 Tax=Polyangium aurulentum TaxID=2567896 RepID=UPI0010ADBC5A|nr:Uma2 family endonuclease [Polyangium aurulentum]UQA59729.1 Uma2 family endonuclease [Polyangium aurulentum]